MGARPPPVPDLVAALTEFDRRKIPPPRPRKVDLELLEQKMRELLEPRSVFESDGLWDTSPVRRRAPVASSPTTIYTWVTININDGSSNTTSATFATGGF